MPRKKVPKAARILARRFNARARYRRKRDQKIAVDYIGRNFQTKGVGTGEFAARLINYNPDTHQVTLLSSWLERKVLDTDEFWKLLRKGMLIPD